MSGDSYRVVMSHPALVESSGVYGTSKWTKDYYICPVSKTQLSITSEEVFNIEVEDDNSYIVDGASVHNCVPGNHGSTRTTTVNMDYVAYMMMATALAEQSNLEFFISETHYMGLHIDRNQDYLDFGECDRVWNFLLTHGNQAKSYVGLPFYSLEKMVRRYSSMTGILWDKMFVGHHHQDVPGPKNAWAVNGSWVGGTEYSQEKMQGSDQPCQRIWGFHPKRGLTWTYPIDLDDATRLEMRPNDQGIYTPYTTVDAADSGGFEFSLHGVEV